MKNLTVVKFRTNGTVIVQIFNDKDNMFNTNNYDHLNVGDVIAFGVYNGTIPKFSYDAEDIEFGFAGNSNPDKRSKSGWRGTTTYGSAVKSLYAHGTRKITRITNGRNKSLTITLSAEIDNTM